MVLVRGFDAVEPLSESQVTVRTTLLVPLVREVGGASERGTRSEWTDLARGVAPIVGTR